MNIKQVMTYFNISVNNGWRLRVHVTYCLTGLVEHPQDLTRRERLRGENVDQIL